MPVDYNPEDAVTAWPEGDYDAVLKKVEDKTSKLKPDGSGGNPMQVWTFDVFKPDGTDQEIKEYVVIPAATFKIKQLARALGKEAEFKAGRFQADGHIGANLSVSLTIEQQEGFDEKNRIARYSAKGQPKTTTNGNGVQPYPRTRESIAAKQPAQNPIAEAAGFREEDIPF